MELIITFFGYFNLVLGIIAILIGFKIYKPFIKEREEEVYKKYIYLFRIGGFGLVIWGLIKIV
jgi:hypothetical protein